jgi:Cu+-exporting ATPase
MMWIIPYTSPLLMMQNQTFNGVPLYVVVFLILATVIQFYVGHIFYISAYKAVKHGSFNMDVLIVLGTTAAWGYGIILTLVGFNYNIHTVTPDQMEAFRMQVMETTHNFEMSSTLLTIILLGKLIESISKHKTVEKLEQLSQLTVTDATLLDQKTEQYL